MLTTILLTLPQNVHSAGKFLDLHNFFHIFRHTLIDELFPSLVRNILLPKCSFLTQYVL